MYKVGFEMGGNQSFKAEMSRHNGGDRWYEIYERLHKFQFISLPNSNLNKLRRRMG